MFENKGLTCLWWFRLTTESSSNRFDFICRMDLAISKESIERQVICYKQKASFFLFFYQRLESFNWNVDPGTERVEKRTRTFKKAQGTS